MEKRARPSVGSVETEAFQRVWAVVTEFGEYERQLNETQSRYRELASKWLLATFAGIGFVLSQEALQLPFDRALAVTALALAGVAGISLLWNLDLLVYHQLLDAVFVEGLRLEDEFAWLPPVRENMLRSQSGTGVLTRVVWFYAAADVGLMFVAGVAVTVWSSAYGTGAVLAGISGSVVLTALVTVYLVLRTKKSESVLRERWPERLRPT